MHKSVVEQHDPNRTIHNYGFCSNHHCRNIFCYVKRFSYWKSSCEYLGVVKNLISFAHNKTEMWSMKSVYEMCVTRPYFAVSTSPSPFFCLIWHIVLLVELPSSWRLLAIQASKHSWAPSLPFPEVPLGLGSIFGDHDIRRIPPVIEEKLKDQRKMRWVMWGQIKCQRCKKLVIMWSKEGWDHGLCYWMQFPFDSATNICKNRL